MHFEQVWSVSIFIYTTIIYENASAVNINVRAFTTNQTSLFAQTLNKQSYKKLTTADTLSQGSTPHTFTRYISAHIP